MPGSSPWLLLRLVGISFSGSLENAGKGIVAFVAGVLVDGPAPASKRILDHPSPGKRRRILHRCTVQKRVAVEGLETLHHVEILRRALEFQPRVEIGRIDHQRIAFPVADRIAQPLMNLWADMLPSDPYNTDLMKIPGQNHHEVRRLHDLVESIEGRRRNRSAAVGKASFAEGPILHAVE